MLPILIQFGEFKIHSFGVLVALGFVAGIWWSLRESRRLGYPPERILDLAFWLLVTGVVGARLLFAAVNWRDFQVFFVDQMSEHGAAVGLLRGVVEVFAVWKGGIVWYGGLLAAFAFGVAYLRRAKLPVWATADALAPGVMLGLAFGRLGCLAAGDDFGRIVESAYDAQRLGDPLPWWTVTFTHPQSLVPESLLGLPLYPTQAMMALNALAIFFVLVWVRRVKTFHGQVVWTMMLLYPVGRFFIEYFRGDLGRGFLIEPWLSTSQAIGLAVFAVAVIMYFRCMRRESAPIVNAPA